jgi:hypothetical protein
MSETIIPYDILINDLQHVIDVGIGLAHLV